MYSRRGEQPRRGLLHGKSICAATWQATIRVLNDVGYHVAAANQISFCKSIKLAHHQHSFQQLVGNTRATVIDYSLPGSGGAETIRHAQHDGTDYNTWEG